MIVSEQNRLMNLKILRPKIIFCTYFLVNILTLVALVLEVTIGNVSVISKPGKKFPTTFKCLLFTHSLVLGAQMIAVFALGIANRKKFPHLLSIYIGITGVFKFVFGPAALLYCILSWHIFDPSVVEVYYDFVGCVFTMLLFETIFAGWAFYVIMVAYHEFLDDASYKELTEPLTPNAV